jgi:hypothetical protein
MGSRTDEQRVIEVHEWERGDPRPGTGGNPRTHPLDTLLIPEGSEIPQVGDILLINVPHLDPERSGPHPFRIISREFLYFRTHDGSDSGSPAKFTRMWVHVRRLTDAEWQSEE